jgi:hypothetical protein
MQCHCCTARSSYTYAVVTVALLAVATLIDTQNQHSASVWMQASCLGCADVWRHRAQQETQTFCWNLTNEELLRPTSCTLCPSTAVQLPCQCHRTKYFVAGNLSQYREHQITDRQTDRHRLYLFIFHHKVCHSHWRNRNFILHDTTVWPDYQCTDFGWVSHILSSTAVNILTVRSPGLPDPLKTVQWVLTTSVHSCKH